MTMREEERQRKLESIARSSEDRHERMKLSKRTIVLAFWVIAWLTLPIDQMIFYPLFGVSLHYYSLFLVGLLIYFAPPLFSLGLALSRPGQRNDKTS
jgi:hypothetical protein